MVMNPLPLFTGSEKFRTILLSTATSVPREGFINRSRSDGLLLINVGLVRSGAITSNSVVIPRF